MKILLFISLFFLNHLIFACNDNMINYADECAVQNKFSKLETEYKKYSINLNHLNGNFLSFALTDNIYNKNINELLHQKESTTIKNQILAMFKVETFIKSNINPILTIDELNKFHAIFSSFDSSANIFDLNKDKFRTLNGITNPKTILNCEDKSLNEDMVNIVTFFDLNTTDGYPLLSIENVNDCEFGPYKSGEIIYYKGPSVKNEMNKWLTELNDTIRRYRNNQLIEIAPYEYLNNMYRWFLAIHPYLNSNENVAKSTLIWAALNLKIPLPQISDQILPYLKTQKEFSNNSKNKLNKEIEFLSACLFEYADHKISDECREINLK